MTTDTYVTRHHGVLGTVVGLTVQASDQTLAEHAETIIIGEITRLEQVFNVYDEESELRRWQRGETTAGVELTEVLGLALVWQRLSAGAYNPCVGGLWTLWDAAEREGDLPRPEVLEAAAAAVQSPQYRLEQGEIAAPGPLDGLNLNAIAKGWIVDRAVAAVANRDLAGLTLNAGGDLVHRGDDALVVGIEDPLRPYDNVPPLVRVQIGDGALATSGGSRRGWVIDGRRYSHVLDPRTGYPVDHVASASVIAPDAATADVVATILTVLRADEGAAFAAELDGIGWCLVDRDGAVHRNDIWETHDVS